MSNLKIFCQLCMFWYFNVLHCAGARTVLELVDGPVVHSLLEQLYPLFHLDHVRRHAAYTVRVTNHTNHILHLCYLHTPE